MPHQTTVTAKIGPAAQLTSAIFADVQELHFDLARLVLQLVWGSINRKRTEIDLTSITTFTISITNKVYTVTLS